MNNVLPFHNILTVSSLYEQQSHFFAYLYVSIFLLVHQYLHCLFELI